MKIKSKHSSYDDIDPALRIVLEADRDWFTANPDRNHLVRPVSEAEKVADATLQKPPKDGYTTYVIVRQIRPDARSRVYFDCPTVHDLEEFSDDDLRTAFDENQKLVPPQVKEVQEEFLKTRH